MKPPRYYSRPSSSLTHRVYQRRLCRRVRSLQPVSEGGVLWTSELGARRCYVD
jgi:hypothetical protein